MTPADGDGLVTSNETLADLALDDATRADFEACWEILCAAPPPELAERHIRAAAALAAKSAAQQPRLTPSGRSLAKAAVISAAAFIGTTGLAAADVLPPAAAHVVRTVADTVRTAVDPMPSELSVPNPVPAPVARAVESSVADVPAEVAGSAAIDPTTTAPTDPTTSLPPASSTTTTVTTLVAATTTTEPAGGSTTTTTTTTVPDDGTATAAGAGSTTTTQPSSTTSTTEPSSSTTTTTPPPTTTP